MAPSRLLFLAALFSFTSIVAAQGIPNIPSCGLPCFTQALTSDGCAGLTDFKCHCGKTQLTTQVTTCVQKDCPNVSDQQAIAKTVSDTCAQAGVPISIPSLGPTSASSSSSSSAPAAAATSSTPAPAALTTPTSAITVPPAPASVATPAPANDSGEDNGCEVTYVTAPVPAGPPTTLKKKRGPAPAPTPSS